MPDPEIVGDDDPQLARFFAEEDLSADEPVPDGGKGLTVLDAEPNLLAPEGLSNEDFWGAAQLANDLAVEEALRELGIDPTEIEA